MSSDSEIDVVTVTEDQPTCSQKRKAYSISRKIEIIDYAKKNSKNAAAKLYKISCSCIVDWVNNEEKLKSEASTCQRLHGGGSKLKNTEFDEQLAKWVIDKRSEKQRVSRRLIQQQAAKLFSLMDEESDFKASSGWLQKFMIRHNFRVRVPTTVCQKPPDEYANVLVNFVMYISQIREKKSYKYIYAADETSVWLDASGGRCIAEKGAKEVSVLSTGHEKLRVTVMLTGRMDGYKCLPFVLLPRKRPDKTIIEMFKGKLIVAWAGTTWMNDILTTEYLKAVLGQSFFGNRLLVWDSFRSHLSSMTKKELTNLNIDTAVIPGGTTKFIQAPDVCWNFSFKSKIQQQYEDWMMHGEREMTSGGKPRPPSMKIYLNWIVEAWNGISKELVIKSFKICGLTNANDGSEDNEINCFKPDGPVSNGRALLKKARDEKELVNLFEEIDIGEDEENGIESDNSIEI